MDEELKNIFDDITKRIAEEEDNAIAKAFTMYIGDCLRREGIIPILTKVEAPCQEISNGNEYQIVSRYGYMFERLDTSEHDRQIINQTIDKCIQAIESTKCLFDNTTRWTMGEKTHLQNVLRQLKESEG